MGIKKTLAGIALAGSLTLSTVSCLNRNNLYDYRGEIDGEKIYLGFLLSGKLEVTNTNGLTKTYFVHKKEVHAVRFQADNSDNPILRKGKIYYNNEIGSNVIKEAQTQYLKYLDKIAAEQQRILLEKQQEGLDLIRQ